MSSEVSPESILKIIHESPKGYTSKIRKLPNIDDLINVKKYTSFGEALYNYVYPGCVNACIVCSSPTKFKQFSHGYYQFCSCSCRAKYFESYKNAYDENGINKGIEKLKSKGKDTAEKARNTCISRYGKTSQDIAAESVKQRRFESLPEILKTKESLISLNLNEVKDKYAISDLKFAYKIFGLAFPKFKTGRSKHEDSIVDFIKSFGVEYKQNAKVLRNRKEIDILIGDIGIEYCGLFWHSDRNNYDKNRHQQKFLEAKEIGIKLYTIFEDEWLFKREIVKSKIANALGKNSNKIYARKCKVETVDVELAKRFLRDTHIAGPKNSGNNICLLYDDEIVACLTYGKARYENNSTEIIRYSTKLGYNVVGGFSRLINKLKLIKGGRIISYSDNRWGDGNMYLKAGFTNVGITPPSYFYFTVNDKIRYHRSAFMKHIILEKYNGDKNLSEKENMRLFGYNRIYDCGTTKWVL